MLLSWTSKTPDSETNARTVKITIPIYAELTICFTEGDDAYEIVDLDGKRRRKGKRRGIYLNLNIQFATVFHIYFLHARGGLMREISDTHMFISKNPLPQTCTSGPGGRAFAVYMNWRVHSAYFEFRASSGEW